jgi:hypothetical protein
MNSARLLLFFPYIHSHKVSSKIRPAFDRIQIAYFFAVSSGGVIFILCYKKLENGQKLEGRKKIRRNNWWAFFFSFVANKRGVCAGTRKK